MPNTDTSQYAAVDLGSNSFHMVVATMENGQLRVIDKLRDQVQLGLGLGEDKLISQEAWDRGLKSLANFGQRLRGVPTANCRVVGTNTLRRAVNGDAFVIEANKLLGHEVEIISGREEARLIYEGVLQDAREQDIARLVIDIGGGSTEIIVGEGRDPTVIESINVGCVSMTQRHFSDGRITSSAMRHTANSTLMEIHPILHKYTRAQWQQAVGCSGTIKAIAQLSRQMGFSEGDLISANSLDQLAEHMLRIGHIKKLQFKDLSERRVAVIPGGLALLKALFKVLDIEQMRVSGTALREGVIYDLHGVQHHSDVQKKTLANLSQQFNINRAQATRVQQTTEFLQQNSMPRRCIDEHDRQPLLFAARLHEIGWSIAHSQYHKHGHYVIANSDMRGFSYTEQQLLANLVRYHRRKLPCPVDNTFNQSQQRALLLLRLAVIINRDRQTQATPPLEINFETEETCLHASSQWLEQNPLTTAELKAEIREWRKAGQNLQLADLT